VFNCDKEKIGAESKTKSFMADQFDIGTFNPPGGSLGPLTDCIAPQGMQDTTIGNANFAED